MNILPELATHEILVDPKGRDWRVHRVWKPRRNTGYDEPLYRLERIVLGHKEWTLNDLEDAGLKVKP